MTLATLQAPLILIIVSPYLLRTAGFGEIFRATQDWIMDKKLLSKRDICSKNIAPAVERAERDMHRQVREEVIPTEVRIIVVKVDQLIALCDQLKACLTQARHSTNS